MVQETTLENMKKDIEELKKSVDEIKNFMDMEPEVRREYVEKLRNKEKERNFEKFSSVEELKKDIEDA